MNKTVTINLAGFSFTIEEQAYEELKTYLDTIRSFLSDEEDVDEIMLDIERRVAELMQDRLTENREVLDQTDVEHVMDILGDPSYFKGDNSDAETEESGSKSRKGRTRKIYRNPDNQIIGGVCGGLGAYFNVDPIIFRLIFVLSLIIWGVGILPYIILWAVIPEAKTTAEKLEMEGEDVNIENIKNRFKKESENVKKSFQNFKNGKGSKAGSQISDGLHQILEFIAALFKMIWNVAKKFLGIGAIIAGSLLSVAGIMILFGAVFNFPFVTVNEMGAFTSHEFATLFFDTTSEFNFIVFTGLLFLFTLVAALLISGFSALGFRPKNRTFIGISIPVILIISLCIFVSFTASAVFQFKNKAKFTEKIILDQVPSDTLIIGAREDGYFSPHFVHHQDHILDLLTIEDDVFVSGRVFVDVAPARDSLWMVEVKKYAHGKTTKEAREKAEGIQYNWNQNGQHLWFDPIFTWDKNLKYRAQEVWITIHVPKDKIIFLSEGTDRVIYDIDNVQNMYDGRMVSKYWKMSSKGLTLSE
ncbi:PspC domain-containing protein [Luteibaculum oceani]|uniref:PspC domain-containing protein n=1 Tax=Luteibaculum oceani TaxID=1294296 RepID=A0A5C6V9U4_9FLAO|nr:PspC domain-containing protein [Luteibaculum oceani]TXC81494.1 PspC domain-containing protein [Luteibaculum oceani]